MSPGRHDFAIRAALLAAAAALWVALGASATVAACSDSRVELRGSWGTAAFAVELADDPATRARGLMFRESLPRFGGMLFVFEQPGTVAFWMKDTLIELDMIFAGSDGTVSRIHHRAQPHDLTPIPGGDNVQYVLEINGGMAEYLGMAEGSEMRHPSIDPEHAVWPCE